MLLTNQFIFCSLTILPNSSHVSDWLFESIFSWISNSHLHLTKVKIKFLRHFKFYFPKIFPTKWEINGKMGNKWQKLPIICLSPNFRNLNWLLEFSDSSLQFTIQSHCPYLSLITSHLHCYHLNLTHHPVHSYHIKSLLAVSLPPFLPFDNLFSTQQLEISFKFIKEICPSSAQNSSTASHYT